jgi:hypothetical protein
MFTLFIHKKRYPLLNIKNSSSLEKLNHEINLNALVNEHKNVNLLGTKYQFRY